MKEAEQNLWGEIDELRIRLQEAEETLRAIRGGEVDALVITGPAGEQVFSLKGADHPYRVIVEEMNEGAVTLSLDGTILYSNGRFAELVQAPLARVIGASIESFLAPDDKRTFQGLLASQDKARAPITLQGAAAVSLPVYISFNRVKIDDTPAVCLVVTDLTEQKRHEAMLAEERFRTQEKVRESDRLAAMGMTAAVLAHEIANPLNWMSTTLQLMRRELLKSPAQDSFGFGTELANMQKEINRLGTLLHEFRSLGRPLQLNLTAVNLNEFATELEHIMLPQLNQAGVRLKLSLSSDLPLISADAEALKRVFINLFKNALEAMPDGGELRLKAYCDLGNIIVEVGDTGVGVPQDLDIFAPFSSTKEKGTGLGLMVVRQLLSSHGGSISYTSQPGLGTTFLITLPLAEAIGKPTQLAQ